MTEPTPAAPGGALVDAGTGERLAADEFAGRVDRRAEELGGLAGGLVLLGFATSIPAIVDYLALRRVGATTALLDPRCPPERLADWCAAYRPDLLIGLAPPPGAAAMPAGGSAGLPRRTPTTPAADRVLLPTSGTTGSPKFVRLSEANLAANAAQIVTALRIEPGHRALATLPLFYSYGLSVLNSHLAAGATVVLTRAAIVRPEFAQVLRDERITSLAGVPFSFTAFERTGLFDRDLPDLVDVTVAGGKLATPAILRVSDSLAARGARFWTMYGQTEATARICVLPPEDLPEHAGSVGFAVPGSSVTITGPDPDGVGEIVVTGPQVMLGYAHGQDDLGGPDTLGGRLATGDLGRVDDAGRLWVTGRASRFTKASGVRISLDDLEAMVAPLGGQAALDGGDRAVVVLSGAPEATGGTEPRPTARELERACRLPHGAIEIATLPEIPRTPAGKPDHRAIARMLDRPG